MGSGKGTYPAVIASAAMTPLNTQYCLRTQDLPSMPQLPAGVRYGFGGNPGIIAGATLSTFPCPQPGQVALNCGTCGSQPRYSIFTGALQRAHSTVK